MPIRLPEVHRDRATVFLVHAKDGFLADCAAPLVQLLPFVLIGFDAADKSFVDLDNVAQLSQVALASFAQPAQDEPCGFLGGCYGTSKTPI